MSDPAKVLDEIELALQLLVDAERHYHASCTPGEAAGRISAVSGLRDKFCRVAERHAGAILAIVRAAIAMGADYAPEHDGMSDHPCHVLYPRSGRSDCSCGMQQEIDRVQAFHEAIAKLGEAQP